MSGFSARQGLIGAAVFIFAAIGLALIFSTLGNAPGTKPSSSAAPIVIATPSPAPCTAPSETSAPRTPRPGEAERTGPGDRCSYISLYVRESDELSALNRNAPLRAVRISLDGRPDAPSIQISARQLPDGGYSMPITSGSTWRILLGGRRLFERDLGSGTEAVCTEAVLHIAAGSSQRFVLTVVPAPTVAECPGPLVSIDASQRITPDEIPPPPVPQLNPVRLGRETGQQLRYRAELITYLQSLEETTDRTGPYDILLFIIGSLGLIAFGAFALWLKFGTHDLGRVRGTMIVRGRRT